VNSRILLEEAIKNEFNFRKQDSTLNIVAVVQVFDFVAGSVTYLIHDTLPHNLTVAEALFTGGNI
jgi:hypothetical protein